MPENTEVQAALVLDFGDGATETFKAHRYANQFLLVKHVDDLFGDGYEALRAASILVMDQVEEDEHARLERFLFEHGREDTYLNAIRDGLGKVWSGETSLPLEPSPDSSATTSPLGGEPSSTGGSSLQDTQELPRLDLAEV